MKHKSLSLVTLAVLLSFGSIAAAQSEPEQFIGQGTIVAFQKYNRHPEKPHQRGMGNFAEEWIVRIDRWETGTKSPGYVLVSYDQVSVRALSDKEINQSKWRFTFREPIFHEAESCAGNAPLPSEQGATAVHFRTARIEDFQRTDQGRSDVFPALKDLPCLIANKPPTEATAQERKNGNVASPKISGEGVIVAFQKYDRYRGELYKKGLTSFDEEWIVRIDEWSTGRVAHLSPFQASAITN